MVKHVLAPQNEFGMPLGQITKEVGFCFSNFPHFPFFLWQMSLILDSTSVYVIPLSNNNLAPLFPAFPMLTSLPLIAVFMFRRC